VPLASSILYLHFYAHPDSFIALNEGNGELKASKRATESLRNRKRKRSRQSPRHPARKAQRAGSQASAQAKRNNNITLGYRPFGVTAWPL